MPHIELRVSPNLSEQVDAEALLKALAERLAQFESVNPTAVKAYQIELKACAVGQGAPERFIHVTASVLSGRSLELRRAMAEALHRIVKQEADRHAAGATVEIREMDRETYIK